MRSPCRERRLGYQAEWDWLKRKGRRARGFVTRELAPETWPDFEALFAKYRGVQAGCWCMHYHRSRPAPGDGSAAEAVERNRQDKKALVDQGRSHGILVYADDRAVGWCQYGPREELPRIDAGRNYRKLSLPHIGGTFWRITCFFVDGEFRGEGVAKVALKAALEAIRKKGGGIVEAYPATNRRAVAVWFGSVGMFETAGFTKVSVLGRSNVVMRKIIR